MAAPLWIQNLFNAIGGVVAKVANNGSAVAPDSTTTQVILDFTGASTTYTPPGVGEQFGTLHVPLDTGVRAVVAPLSLSGGTLSAPGVLTNAQNITFLASVVNPTITLADNPATNGAGTTICIQAQNATGSGTTTGGNIALNTGSGTTPGVFDFNIGGAGTVEQLTENEQLLGVPIVFENGIVPSITQKPNPSTSSVGSTLSITAQSAVSSGSSGANLALGSGQGVDFAHAGIVQINVGPATGMVLSPTGTTVANGNLTLSPNGSESQEIAAVAGFTLTEFPKWFQVTNPAGAFNCDITVSADGIYQVDYEVLARGGTQYGRKETLYLPRSGGSFSGFFTGTILFDLLSPPTTAMSVSNPDGNTIRLTVTPANTTATVWVIKALVRLI